ATAEREAVAAVALVHQARPAKEPLFQDHLRATGDGVEAQPQRGFEELPVARTTPLPGEERRLTLDEPEDIGHRRRGLRARRFARVPRQAHRLELVLPALHAE